MDLLYQIDDPVHSSAADGLNRFVTNCMWNLCLCVCVCSACCRIDPFVVLCTYLQCIIILIMCAKLANIVNSFRFVLYRRFFHTAALCSDSDGFHRFSDGILDASVIVGGHHTNGTAANYARQFEQHQQSTNMSIQRWQLQWRTLRLPGHAR